MCKGHKGHCSLGLECSSGHRLIFLCSVHNQLFGYRASLLSAHVLAVVYFLLTSFPVGSHAPSQANAPSPLTWLESGLPVNIKSQYGLQMFFLCHPRSRFSLLFWIFFFFDKGNLEGAVGHHADPQMQPTRRSPTESWILLPPFEDYINLELKLNWTPQQPKLYIFLA